MAKWHYEAKWSILNGVLTISENSHIVRVTIACCDHGCTEFHLGNIGLDMEQGPITPTYVTPEAVERVMGTDSDERERRPDGQGMTLAS